MPEVVGGKLDGEIAMAGFTSNENGCVLDAVALSVTVTEKTKVVGEATAFGIPPITPVLPSDIPGGTEPLANVKTNGGVPPMTPSTRVQLVPAVQAGRGFGLITGAALMVRVKLTVAPSPNESVAVTLTGKAPETEGVPTMPTREPVVGLTESPPGSPDEVHV
jgi:hypothetical protein